MGVLAPGSVGGVVFSLGDMPCACQVLLGKVLVQVTLLLSF